MIAPLGIYSLVFLLLPATTHEDRGRTIYRTGQSPSGARITAVIGEDEVEVPANVVPCASCHGRDGRGKEEGGVRPSNLQWDALARPYAVPTSGGRTHPPYTRSLLKRAITMGVDPANNRLHAAMPRYRMSLQDAEDLVAYLRILGSGNDPGLSDDAVRIGVILPSGGERTAIRETVLAYFDRVNRDGGIFGRRVDVAFGDVANAPAFIDEQQPFAIASAYIVGREEEFGKIVAERRVPAIASFSARGGDRNRYLFHLLARVEEQSMALIDTLPAGAPVRIVHDEGSAELASELARRLAGRVTGDNDAPAVLFLGQRDALAKLLASGAPTTILIPALFASEAIFTAPPAARVFVALPTSLSDETPDGTAELRALGPSLTHRVARATALGAAKLLTRALQRAGRDVDRESLVDTLEAFSREPTNVTPPITWSPNRHVGTTDCTILSVDVRTRTLVPVNVPR